MSKVTSTISMSLDGYVAGPDPSLQDPLGEGGADSEVIQERLDAIGASIMGRKMDSGGSGPWEDDYRVAS